MIAMFFGTALAMQAQQVTLVSPSSMQFSDPASGASFRYPAKWNYSGGGGFYLPVSIASSDNPARGIVFVESGGGYDPYPNTTLNGAEFVYATRKTATEKECLALTLPDDGDSKAKAASTINGIKYAHGRTQDAGMCHQVQEDVYAAYRNQTCYLFDLAVHTICAGVKDNMREITSSELAEVHASLEKILASIQISDLKKD